MLPWLSTEGGSNVDSGHWRNEGHHREVSLACAVCVAELESIPPRSEPTRDSQSPTLVGQSSLRGLKKRFDPNNFFRHNRNISTGSSAALTGLRGGQGARLGAEVR